VLDQALRDAGVASTFIRMKEAGHGFGGPEIDERVRKFFDKHLRNQDVEISADAISSSPRRNRGR
jgi:hypothetical protein